MTLKLITFLIIIFFTPLLCFPSKTQAAYKPIRVLFTVTPPERLATYLDYLNIPYDINNSFTQEDVIGNYSTIATVGEGGGLVDNSLEPVIVDLVEDDGIGYIHCGWNTNEYASHDPTLLSLWNMNTVNYSGTSPSGNITVTDNSHFITQYYSPGGTSPLDLLIDSYTYQMGIVEDYTTSNGYPKILGTHTGNNNEALIVNTPGNGRAVWFNYRCSDFLNTFAQGYTNGAFVNALIWTSEPTVGQHFAFAGFPTYWTIRVDDVTGGFETMFSEAEEHGLKLTNYLFLKDVDENPDYFNVINTYYLKNHSMGVHDRDASSMGAGTQYFYQADYTQEEIDADFTEIRNYYTSWGIRQPSVWLPSGEHWHSNIFSNLESSNMIYNFGMCRHSYDGGINVQRGEPFGDFTTNHLDLINSSESTQIWCFDTREFDDECFGGVDINEDIQEEKDDILWAFKGYIPAIPQSHEYIWTNYTESYIDAWLDGIVSYLNTTIPGWSSLAGEFMAPIMVQHKNIDVSSAQYDSSLNKYQITVTGTTTLPVPVTIYEPSNSISGWNGTREIIRNDDFYHLFIPSGSGSRSYTIELSSGTPSNDFGYIYKTDTYIESTKISGLGIKVDPYSFGTVYLEGYGGGISRGSTVVQSDGSFSGSATMTDDSEQWALVPMKITPSTGSLTVTIDTWDSSGDYYKKWTESGSTSSITSAHTVGDLKPNTEYVVKVDGNIIHTQVSNSSGQITFTYSGGYSTKTFEVTPSSPSPYVITPITDTTTFSRRWWISGQGSLETEIIEEEQVPAETEEEKRAIEEEGYLVKVKVVNEKKQPVEGAKVTLYSDPKEAFTDKDGIATFENVEKGEHTIVISYNGQVGEERVNLEGDFKEFSFTIQIKPTNPLTTPIVILSLSISVLAIGALLVWVYRLKKIRKR